MKYDVAIVGAGTGGTGTAIALEKSGLKVVILEYKNKEKIGDKVCGDATSPSYFKRVRGMGVDLKDPTVGKGIDKIVTGFLFIPPKYENKLAFHSTTDGWILDRHIFGQHLVDSAIDKGAELLDECKVLTPIIENDSLRGVTVRHKGEKKDIKANVFVDASGVNAIIRKQLNPEKTYMEHKILDKDMCYAYREIRELKEELEYPDYLHLYFDTDKAPGGYFWLFPKQGNIVNIGLGVHLGQGQPPRIKKLFDKAINDVTFLKGSKKLFGGSWKVPLRRPIDTCVWNGLLLVGDAGSQVKPTDGGGIGISIEAGAFAAKTIMNAHESGDFTRDNLWSYNIDSMNHIGAINGPLELGKREVIGLTSKQIQEIFRCGILQADDLHRLNAGIDLTFGKVDLVKRAWKGKRLPFFLLGILSVMRNMKKAKKLYLNYPETFNDFIDWKERIEKIYG
ncbi:MAG: NAD(P)/FAD-dependent oxidoreductase [Candidatus Hodarchaeales archaeon]|jgi:geranylgeranyl reductase family protein